MILVKALVLFSVIAGNLGCQSFFQNLSSTLSNQYPTATTAKPVTTTAKPTTTTAKPTTTTAKPVTTTAKPTTTTPSKPKDLCSACKDGCTGTLEDKDVKLEVFKGNLYYFVTESTTYKWDPADKACQAWFPGQGHSVSFHSEAEFNWVKQRVLENEMDVVHIGAHRQRGKWYWTDKTEVNNTLFDQFWLHSGAGLVGNVMQIHSTEESYGFIGIRGPTGTASFICKVTCADSSTCSFGDEASERLKECPMSNVQGVTTIAPTTTPPTQGTNFGVCFLQPKSTRPGSQTSSVYCINKYEEEMKDKDILNKNCRCGVSNSMVTPSSKTFNATETKNTKIWGVGSSVTKNEFPWVVGLSSKPGGDIFCGGSIIDSKTILTAAHCLVGLTELYVRVAEHDQKKNDGEFWIQACDIKKHELYAECKKYNGNREFNRLDFDYGVVSLCKEITFNREISPVCLPSIDHPGQEEDFEKKTAIMVGWGATKEVPQPNGETSYKYADILKELKMETISNEDCKIQAKDPWFDLTNVMCAASEETGKGTGEGDSGGPLVSVEKTIHTQIGIDSYGPVSMNVIIGQKKITKFARVTKNIKWIKDNSNGHKCEKPSKPESCEILEFYNGVIENGLLEERYIKRQNTEFWYLFVKINWSSWIEAEKSCSDQGGHLTSIHSKEEYDWISNEVKTLAGLDATVKFSIGGYRIDMLEPIFVWTDYSKMDMDLINSLPGIRDYGDTSLNRMEIWGKKTEIMNVKKHKETRGFICKVDCNDHPYYNI